MAWNLTEFQNFLKSDFKNAIIILLVIAVVISQKQKETTQEKYDDELKLRLQEKQNTSDINEKMFFRAIELTQGWQQLDAVSSRRLYEQYGIKNDSPYDADSMPVYNPKQRRK